MVNVAVSTLNMWNVLYILRIIGKRLYKVIGKSKIHEMFMILISIPCKYRN